MVEKSGFDERWVLGVNEFFKNWIEGNDFLYKEWEAGGKVSGVLILLTELEERWEYGLRDARSDPLDSPCR